MPAVCTQGRGTGSKTTYTMEYRCSNCGHVFKKEVEKGSKARGRGGICPYCGVEDCNIYSTGNFNYRKPSISIENDWSGSIWK